MQNKNGHNKHPRGSSSPQEAEKGRDDSMMVPFPNPRNRSGTFPADATESASDKRVRGLRSIQENPKDSLPGIRQQELNSQQHATGTQSDDYGLRTSSSMSLWRDDGGDCGEEV